jgi:hypothetical protein
MPAARWAFFMETRVLQPSLTSCNAVTVGMTGISCVPPKTCNKTCNAKSLAAQRFPGPVT